MEQSRRGFLKVSLGGAALLAMAGAGIALQRSRPLAVRGGRTLLFFSETEYATVAAAVDRLLARDTPEGVDARQTGGAPSPGLEGFVQELAKRPPAPTPAEVDVAGKMDAFLAPLDPASKKELKQLLALFENGLFSLLGGLTPIPFTQKTPAQQDLHLAAWAQSRLGVKRTGFQVLKRLAAAIYFGAPETFASNGYPGPPVELVRSVLEARKAQAPAPAPTGAPR